MKIYVEMPEAVKPEKAWVEGKVLHVDYHRWDRNMFYYVDAHATIPFEEILEFVMRFGPRRGFKGLRLLYGHRNTVELKMSENHEEVVIQIYNLLKRAGLQAKREIVTGKEVKN
jgi:hypothetical protein